MMYIYLSKWQFIAYLVWCCNMYCVAIGQCFLAQQAGMKQSFLAAALLARASYHHFQYLKHLH